MRALAPSALPLLLMLAACGGGAPSVTTPNASAALSKSVAAQAAGALPIKGHCELTFNPPPLPLPPVHRQIDTGTCWFSHLGKTALQGVQDINFAAGTQSGTRTFTAANGDVLRATHAGTSGPGGPGLVRFVTTITIVGGTGRFANATGIFTVRRVLNQATGLTTGSFEGTVSSPGAGKS